METMGDDFLDFEVGCLRTEVGVWWTRVDFDSGDETQIKVSSSLSNYNQPQHILNLLHRQCLCKNHVLHFVSFYMDEVCGS